MLQKIKESKFAKRIGIIVASVAMFAVSVFSASAAEGDVDIAGEITSQFASVTGDMKSVLIGILPYALGLIGLSLAITLGIKYFKKLSGKA